MDERQAQIRERAGLEESRLNLEFIDWLRKWGTPILIAAALLAGAFTVRERYQKSKSAEVDSAFQELEAARAGGNASPDALLAVADDFEGVRAVSILARLEAADAYMDAVRRGTKPGAPVDAQGALTSAEDVLNDADRDQFLTKAEALYKQVEGETSSNPSQVPLTLGTLYGQAAVVESRGDYDAARGFYERVIALAESSGFTAHAAVARSRMANQAGLGQLAPLYSKAELPQPPAPPTPPAPEITPVEAPTISPGTPVEQPAAGGEGTVPATPPPPAEPAPSSPSSPPPLPK